MLTNNSILAYNLITASDNSYINSITLQYNFII